MNNFDEWLTLAKFNYPSEKGVYKCFALYCENVTSYLPKGIYKYFLHRPREAISPVFSYSKFSLSLEEIGNFQMGFSNLALAVLNRKSAVLFIGSSLEYIFQNLIHD